MKNYVLTSGGLDSTILAKFVADLNGGEMVFLRLYYGQKHAVELEYARRLAEKYGVRSYEYNMEELFKVNINASSLLSDSTRELPLQSYAAQLEELANAGKLPTVSTYVPYRNGIMLSIAASIALQDMDLENPDDAGFIWYGAHADDAAGAAYPDCTQAFIESQGNAILYGTNGRLALCAPFAAKTKAEVVGIGRHHEMTLEEMQNTWSCYNPQEVDGSVVPCGKCGTCIDREAALRSY